MHPVQLKMQTQVSPPHRLHMNISLPLHRRPVCVTNVYNNTPTGLHKSAQTKDNESLKGHQPEACTGECVLRVVKASSFVRRKDC